MHNLMHVFCLNTEVHHEVHHALSEGQIPELNNGDPFLVICDSEKQEPGLSLCPLGYTEF